MMWLSSKHLCLAHKLVLLSALVKELLSTVGSSYWSKCGEQVTTEYSILNEHLQYLLQDSGDITKEIWRKCSELEDGVLWTAVFQAWHRQCLHSQLTRLSAQAWICQHCEGPTGYQVRERHFLQWCSYYEVVLVPVNHPSSKLCKQL